MAAEPLHLEPSVAPAPAVESLLLVPLAVLVQVVVA